MAEYVQIGNNIDYQNTGETHILPGDVVVMSKRIGVALSRIEPREVGAVAIAEAFRFPAGAEEIPIGSAVFWDVQNSVITKTETGNTPAGIAVSANIATTGDVVVRLE